jgi:hypothetical protein
MVGLDFENPIGVERLIQIYSNELRSILGSESIDGFGGQIRMNRRIQAIIETGPDCSLPGTFLNMGHHSASFTGRQLAAVSTRNCSNCFLFSQISL